MTFEKVEIDVSELAPPEPLLQILNSLSQLSSEQYLEVRHRQEPCLLFSRIEEKYSYRVLIDQENNYQMIIWNKANKYLEKEIEDLIS